MDKRLADEQSLRRSLLDDKVEREGGEERMEGYMEIITGSSVGDVPEKSEGSQ